MERNFMQMLSVQWAAGKFVSVGLDSERERVPEVVKSAHSHSGVLGILFQFNKAIIDSTCDLACVFKINSAFYEVHGMDGITVLMRTIAYIKGVAPFVPVILDAKRTDIGNTNKQYAIFAFEVCGADAITVNPYFGGESLEPFLSRKDKGIFILCRTSNPGAEEFQGRKVSVSRDEARKFDEAFGYQITELFVPLYQLVALRVASEWNKNGNCGLVVGATAPEELKSVREIVGEVPILIPGIGAQGGDLEESVMGGCCKDGKFKGIINSSRGIIFASKGEDFAEKAREETKKLTNQIRQILNWRKEEVKL